MDAPEELDATIACLKKSHDLAAAISLESPTTVLLTKIEDWEEVIKEPAQDFGKIRPFETIMQATRLLNPQWLVEFEADAVI